MMSMIQQLLGDKAGAMLEQLQQVGFEGKQAQEFLNVSGEKTVELLKEEAANTDISSLPQKNLVSSLMGKMDVDTLASKVGIDSGLAGKGLQAILPVLVSVFASKGALGDIGESMGQSQGGIMDKVKSSIGKLF